MSKGSNLVKNTLILAFGTVSTKFIGFFLLPLYTRYLSPDEYGIVDVATVFLSLLVPSLTLQLSMALFRYLVGARGKREELTSIMSNIFSMTFILAVPWIAVFIIVGQFIEIRYLNYIILTGVAMLFSQHAFQVARGLGSNKQFALASILTGLVTLAGAFVFIAWLQLGAEGMLISIALAHFIAAGYLFFVMRIYTYIRRGQKNKLLRREILGYSTPLVPNGIAWWLNNAATRVLITLMIGTAANGVFAVATKFAGALTSFFSVFSMSWTESATLHIDEPDRDEFFSKVANSAVRIFGALGIGLIAGVPFIFPIMVDSSFASAYNYVPIMVIGVFFNALVGIYSAIYVAKKLTMKVMNTTLIGSVANIVLSLCLIPVFDLYGAVFSTVITFLILAVVRHIDVKKYVEIKYEKRIFVLLVGLLAIVITTYYLEFIWLHVTGLTIAVAAAFLLNRIQIKQMWGILRNRITR